MLENFTKRFAVRFVLINFSWLFLAFATDRPETDELFLRPGFALSVMARRSGTVGGASLLVLPPLLPTLSKSTKTEAGRALSARILSSFDQLLNFKKDSICLAPSLSPFLWQLHYDLSELKHFDDLPNKKNRHLSVCCADLCRLLAILDDKRYVLDYKMCALERLKLQIQKILIELWKV